MDKFYKDISEIHMHYLCDCNRACRTRGSCQEECFRTCNRDNALNQRVVDTYYEFINAYDRLRQWCNFQVYSVDSEIIIDIIERRENERS